MLHLTDPHNRCVHHDRHAECQVQVSKLAGEGGEDRVQVAARGELQLGLLIEGMRRDGFELEISAPEVLLRQERGRTLEPLEEAHLECPLSCVGACRQFRSGRLAVVFDRALLRLAMRDVAAHRASACTTPCNAGRHTTSDGAPMRARHVIINRLWPCALVCAT